MEIAHWNSELNGIERGEIKQEASPSRASFEKHGISCSITESQRSSTDVWSSSKWSSHTTKVAYVLLVCIIVWSKNYIILKIIFLPSCNTFTAHRGTVAHKLGITASSFFLVLVFFFLPKSDLIVAHSGGKLLVFGFKYTGLTELMLLLLILLFFYFFILYFVFCFLLFVCVFFCLFVF